MALTAQESLRLLYGAPGLVYQVRTFIRCDQVGTSQGGVDDIATGFVVDADVWNQLLPGDIVQFDDEDMAFISKSAGNNIAVRRAINSTIAAQHPATGTLWVWRDISDAVTNDHGIAAVSSIRRSFEKNIDSFETSTADLKALNKDRFWDRVALPTGITSYRHHWVRFYIRTLRGGLPVDIRALATMMISDVRTDDTDVATLKLVGIGSLLREKQDADIVRFGRENFVYHPTSLVVKGILEKVEELRYVGSQQYNGIPTHWARALCARAGRTISLPANTSTISHFGRPNEFVRQESQVFSPSPYFQRNSNYPAAPMPGGFVTAMAYDPGASGSLVQTGDPARAGRWFLGIGSDLWEFDEVTLQSAIRVAQIAGSSEWRIRRLWFNTNDNSVPSSSPKICGAAWADYATVVPANATFTNRCPNGCRLFRWNGGASPSNTFDVASGSTQFWPGTHCFRNGQTSGVGGITAGNPNQGENVSLPFSQRIAANDMLQINLFAGIRQYEGQTDQYGNQLAYRYQPNVSGTAANFEPGIVHDAINNSVTGGGVAATLNRAFYGIFTATTADHNFKFTLGQMGAMDFVADPSALNAWSTNGAILFCTMDTTTGIITVKAWNVISSTVTTIYNALTQPYQQPIAICGNEGGAWSSGRCYAIAWMEWSETGNSTAKIITSNLDNTTRTTVYDALSDNSYLSPVWMQLVEGSAGPKKLIVTFYSRIQTARPDQYQVRGFKSDTAYTGITPDLTTGSCWHAYVKHTTDKDAAYALDSGGRLLKCVTDPTNGNVLPASTVIYDRGFAPIDGEHWSANHKLCIPSGVDRLYGVTFPFWPFGDDIRGFRREGRYIMWKHDINMMDNTELAYFKDKTMEEAMADLAFASLSVWGFDKDGRGNFSWDDRIKATTPVVTLGDKADRTTRMSKRRGYEDVENQVEITPVTFRDGEIRATIDLTSRKTVPISETTVNTKSSPQPIDVQALDPKQSLVALKCIQGGRVGAARFSYYYQGGTLKGWLADSYSAGVAVSTVNVAGSGRSYGANYNETITDDRGLQMQVPTGARIHFPDGTDRAVTSVGVSAANFMIISLDASWTPAQKVYAGSPVDIDLEVDRNLTSSTSTFTKPDGKDILTSSYEWQELGAGTKWASGILIRFLEPPDNGFDINYKEAAWSVGDLITIEVPGLELVTNGNSKVVAFDYDSIKKYGKRTYDSQRGNLLARKAFYISNARLQLNKRPRWIWNVETHLAPYLSLFDVVRLYNPKLNPVSPYTDDATIRSITHDVARGVTRFEAIGSFHD